MADRTEADNAASTATPDPRTDQEVLADEIAKQPAPETMTRADYDTLVATEAADKATAAKKARDEHNDGDESLTGVADAWRQVRMPDGSLRLSGPDIVDPDGKTTATYPVPTGGIVLAECAAP